MAFQGQCIEQCPEGLYYANYSKDCQERGMLSCIFSSLVSSSLSKQIKGSKERYLLGQNTACFRSCFRF